MSLLTLVPGAVGGTETYARALLDEFAQRPERMTVLAGEATARTLTSGEVVAVPYALGSSTIGRAAGLARGLLAPPAGSRAVVAGADVVHFPLTVPIPRGPAPAVVTLHDVLHLDLPDTFSAAERTYRRFAYDRAARRAAGVITGSEHARQRIAARLAIPAERIVAIPHGIDHVRFQPTGDTTPLAGLALPPEPFVLYPANLWPHKNHERLLVALASTNATLVLTGAAYGHLDALLDTATRLGVRNRVHHLGYVPAAALAPLYRRARALVFPSRYEGFGLPVLEAMACGCPVASSDAGAVAEAGGEAALTFAAEDTAAMARAIDRVTTDASLREELRGRGLERARAFTWERAADRHAEVYVSTARRR
jgi:glycosyltransferase involved in cell wall biosynthesis